MNLKKYALGMLANGLCVMPPRDDGTKRPFARWKEYQSRLPTENEVSAWYANGKTSIGIVTGYVSGGIDGGLECIDFDDMATYDQFMLRAAESEVGAVVSKVKQGYCEQSPRGVHVLYYCAEIGENEKLATRLADGKATIETRGEGGFVVTAPTSWPDKNYTVITGGVETIASITPAERTALFSLARSFNEVAKKQDTPRQVPSVPTADRPGDDFIQKASWSDILTGWTLLYTQHDTGYWIKPGSASKTHHITTNYKGSDLLYSFSTSTPFIPERGYNKFAVYTILHHGGDSPEHFKAANKALRAQGYGSEPVEDLPQWAQEPAKTCGQLMTFADVCAATFEPIRWVVPDLIPEGCTILAGAPKIGKSWLATELCLCAASGGKRPFLGKYKLDHVGALYLALEDSDRRLNDRILKLTHQVPAWSEHFVAPPSAVHYRTQFPALHQGCIAQLTEHLDTYPDCKLVLVDTLQKIRPPAGKNLTAYEMDYEVISAFQQLAIHRHIAIVLLHHLRKSTGMLNEDPFEQVSGSMGLSGAADSTIVLHKGKSSNLAELYVRGRDVEEQTITLKLENGTWFYMGTGMESEGRKYLSEIKEFAKEKNIIYFKPADFNRWYRENNGSEIKCIRNVFQRLYQDNHLMKWDAGKYSLPGVKDKVGNKE